MLMVANFLYSFVAPSPARTTQSITSDRRIDEQRVAAVNWERQSRYPCRFVGAEPERRVGDIDWVAEPLKFGGDGADGTIGQWLPDDAGTECVSADVLIVELFRQILRGPDLPGFCYRIRAVSVLSDTLAG